jgi:hypothetical protein
LFEPGFVEQDGVEVAVLSGNSKWLAYLLVLKLM